MHTLRERKDFQTLAVKDKATDNIFESFFSQCTKDRSQLIDLNEKLNTKTFRAFPYSPTEERKVFRWAQTSNQILVKMLTRCHTCFVSLATFPADDGSFLTLTL